MFHAADMILHASSLNYLASSLCQPYKYANLKYDLEFNLTDFDIHVRPIARNFNWVVLLYKIVDLQFLTK